MLVGFLIGGTWGVYEWTGQVSACIVYFCFSGFCFFLVSDSAMGDARRAKLSQEQNNELHEQLTKAVVELRSELKEISSTEISFIGSTLDRIENLLVNRLRTP